MVAIRSGSPPSPASCGHVLDRVGRMTGPPTLCSSSRIASMRRAHIRIGCDATNRVADLGGVGRVGSEVPADAERSSWAALSGWSTAYGMATIGTAYHSASVQEPIPAWVTNASATRSTAGCGTVARTWTQSGTAPSRSGATLPVAMVSRQPLPSRASIVLRYKSIRSV